MVFSIKWSPMTVLLLELTSLASVVVSFDASEGTNWHKLVAQINSVPDLSWRAHPWHKIQNKSSSDISRLWLGVLPYSDSHKKLGGEAISDGADFPATFDWRNQTGNSSCIGGVVDQGQCGSCWAVSTANAFSDRRCLAIRGSGAEEPRVDFSSLDVIACDKLCHGLEHCCRGCTGGYPDLAWEFIQKTGIVTSTCMPYNLTRSLLCPLPLCLSPLNDTKYFAKSSRQVVGGVPSIQAELFQNGPVVAVFRVYEDFMTYSSGVYTYTSGKYLGLHAVKVIGYSKTSEGTSYWIAQNSWGDSWGMKGYFWIQQGDCGFEEDITSGLPDLRHI